MAAKRANQKEAYFAALVHRQAMYRLDQGLADPVTPGKLRPQPLILHDLDQKPLFYFFLEKNPRGKITGSSWVTADPQAPPKIVSETWSELTWNPNKARAQAKNWAKGVLQPGEKAKVFFICYRHHKIGVLAQITRKGCGVRTEKIFDVVSGKEISLNDTKKQRKKHLRVSAVSRAAALPETVRKPAKAWYHECLPSGVRAMPPLEIESQAAACTRSLNLVGTPHELPVPCHRQEQESWCVPACAQMILGYYHIDKEQDVIAGDMGTDEQGTPLENEEQGYEKYPGVNWDLSEETTLDFVKQKIDNDKAPVRMRLNDEHQEEYHAVVCIGYRRVEVAGGGAEVYLIVNDPSRGRRSDNWNDWRLRNFLTISKT
jgi:hypothetical protein